MDFSKITSITRRYLWLFALVTLVAALTTYFAISSKPAIFEAKTRLLIGPSMDSPSPDLNALRIGGQLIQTYAEMVSSRPFLESVNEKLDQKADLDLLTGAIEAKQNVDTRILTVFVRHRNPNQAVAIANAIAMTLVEMSPSKDNTTTLLRAQLGNQSQQLEQIITNSQTSIDELEAKLLALSNVTAPSAEAAQANRDQQDLVMRQLSDERTRLSETLRTLTTLYGVLRDTNANQVEIIEPAGVVYPENQNIPLRVAASALAGLILAVSIIFSIEYYSDSIRFPGDLSRAAKAPLLTTVEKQNRLERSRLERVVTLTEPHSRTTNNYRTAVAKLLFSMGKSIPYSFMLSSVGSQSGEDTAEAVANLGIAFAQSGNRVVLVDAQLHNPLLTELFEAKDKAGLAEFIANSSSKPKLLPIKDVAGVRLLPAGISAEIGSGTVLSSSKLANLIEELQKEADIVLVAGSPLSWFAENLTLATQVNSVILVARPGEARAKNVNEVVENLRDMNIHVAGVIFDNNQPSIVFKLKPRNISTGTRVAPGVAPEDSHV